MRKAKEREREGGTRRCAFRRQLRELRDTLASNSTNRSCVICVHRQYTQGERSKATPDGTVRVAKVQWMAPAEGRCQEPPRRSAEAPPWLRTPVPSLGSRDALLCICVCVCVCVCVCICSRVHAMCFDCVCTFVWIRIRVCMEEKEREREWNPPSTPHPTPSGPFVLLLVRGLSRPSKSISTPATNSSSSYYPQMFLDKSFWGIPKGVLILSILVYYTWRSSSSSSSIYSLVNMNILACLFLRISMISNKNKNPHMEQIQNDFSYKILIKPSEKRNVDWTLNQRCGFEMKSKLTSIFFHSMLISCRFDIELMIWFLHILIW